MKRFFLFVFILVIACVSVGQEADHPLTASKVTGTARLCTSGSPGLATMTTIVTTLKSNTITLFSTVATYTLYDLIRVEASGTLRVGPKGQTVASMALMSLLSDGDIFEYRYNGAEMGGISGVTADSIAIITVIREH
jgi:hypothetical protein